VWPSGKSRNAERGGLTARVMSRALVMQSVGIPAASACLATSPTDWWQTGQTGTSSTASTPSSRNRAVRAGARSPETRREE
jgi:hypothetical protein